MKETEANYRNPLTYGMLLLVLMTLGTAPLRAAPGAFNVTFPGDTSAPGPLFATNQITFQWEASAGASSYELYVRDLDTQALSTYPVTGTSKTLTLYPGTPYKWNVGAYSGVNQSGLFKQSSNSRWLQVGICDLYVVGNVSLDPNPVPAGQDVTIKYTVGNQGSGASIASSNRIQIKMGFSADTLVQGDFYLPAIGTNKSVLLEAKLTIPQTAAKGSYSVHVILDMLKYNVETDYSNDTHSEWDVLGISDAQFSVTSSAGIGGTISPIGQQTVKAGSNLGFTATADEGYSVDQWYLDNVAVQAGKNTYTLLAINANHVVSATFKLNAYTLTVLQQNGSVTIDPPLTEFPHGGEVLLTAHPDQNYWLYDWRGDALGVGDTLRLTVTRNMTIRAYFQPLISPISMQVANSTPSTNPRITLPATPEFLYVIQCSDDSMFSWRDLCVVSGNNSASVDMNPHSGKTSEIFRTVELPVCSTAPFLLFPVTNVITKARYTSSSTPVSSIFDHHGPNTVPVPYASVADGAIETYRGELLTILNSETTAYSAEENKRVTVNNERLSPYYYKKQLANGARAFTLIAMKRQLSTLAEVAFTYQSGDEYIYYDGHSGYDYVVGQVAGERVKAAAEGWLVPEDFDCYNTISIDHGNGYKTCYFHMRFDELDAGILTNGQLERKFIKAGQVLGSPGDVGGCSGKKVDVHLHFEVRKKALTSGNREAWSWVDPYGQYASDHNQFCPPLWLPGE